MWGKFGHKKRTANLAVHLFVLRSSLLISLLFLTFITFLPLFLLLFFSFLLLSTPFYSFFTLTLFLQPIFSPLQRRKTREYSRLGCCKRHRYSGHIVACQGVYTASTVIYFPHYFPIFFLGFSLFTTPHLSSQSNSSLIPCLSLSVARGLQHCPPFGRT